MQNRHCYLAFAPMQGHTTAAYRHAHCLHAGGVDEYYTPFVRLEHGEPRARDLRDLSPALIDGVPTAVQVIADGADEFARLCDAVQQMGHRRIDLNIGCPFPMQVHAGRGSGLLTHPDRIEAIAREMLRRPEVLFSVKMRIGQDSTDEGIAALKAVDAMPLRHITIHPRLGRQQYKGVPDMEAFALLLSHCHHPVVYNGDLQSEAAVQAVLVRHPSVAGAMLGRGLLSKPWMFTDRHPCDVAQAIHNDIHRHAVNTLCGDSQILSHLHPFWEYLSTPVEHRLIKAVRKSTRLRRYDEAVAAVFRQWRQCND